MFDPGRIKEVEKERELKRRACERVRGWCEEIINGRAIEVQVREIMCDGIDCSPVDTVVELIGKKNVEIHYGLRFPLMALHVQKSTVVDQFPDEDTLSAWDGGFDTEWPPPPPPPAKELKFKVADKVLAWLGGSWRTVTIESLWWRNKKWPKHERVPYALRLPDTDTITYAPNESYVKPLSDKEPNPPKQESPHEPAWRFQIRDKVECKMAEGWRAGAVAYKNVLDPHLSFSPLEKPVFALVPYVVDIGDSMNGRRIIVPVDYETVIRPAPPSEEAQTNNDIDDTATTATTDIN